MLLPLLYKATNWVLQNSTLLILFWIWELFNRLPIF